MKKLTLTENEERVILLIQAKELEDQYDIHDANEATLLNQMGGELSEEILGTFLHAERSAKTELDSKHSSIKTKLDRIKPAAAPK